MNLKEILTGGPRVQEARQIISELESRDHLSYRSQRRLAEERRVTRRHLIGLGIKGVGLLGLGAVSGSFILRGNSEHDFSNRDYSDIGEGLRLDYGQDDVQDISRKCAEDLSYFCDIVFDSKYVGAATRLFLTKKEFADFLIANSPNQDTGTRIYAENAYAANTQASGPVGLLILVNKEKVDEDMATGVNNANAKKVLYAQVEEIIQHEVVHFTTNVYKSEALNDVVFNRLFANKYKGQKIGHIFVVGASVVASIGGSQSFANEYSLLEEAEAFFIGGQVIKDKDRQITLPFLRPDQSGKFVTQIKLLKLLLKKVEPDEREAAKLLQRLRAKIGGREEFCRLISKANPDKDTAGRELLYGMTVLYAVNAGDERGFNSLVSTK